MQVTTLWKKITAGAGGLGAIAVLALTWQQLGWPWFASADDVMDLEGRFQIHSAQVEAQIDARAKMVQTQIEKLDERIDGMDRLNLYRERDRVEDKIDELEDRAEVEPHNASLKELIRYRYRERDEIDRQIDELNNGG